MTGADARGAGAAGRARIAERLGAPAALLVAALVRFHGLGARSLWTDEGSTWTAASLPLHALLRRCVERDASPPLYYLLTSWCLRLGDDEAHLRLVSALASLALVWLTYRLARLALSRPLAALAAMLTALSPFQVMYAQEARTYTLVAALLTGATFAWARLMARPGPRAWGAFVALTALGLWTQSIAALGVIGQGAIAVLAPEGRRRILPWLGGLAAAAALYLPWMWYGRGVAGHMSSSHWYVPGTSAHGIFKVLRALLVTSVPIVSAPPDATVPGLDRYLPRALAWLLVTLPPLAALAPTLPLLGAPHARGRLARLAWAGWAAPLLAVLAVSVQRPLLLARYFVFVTPFVSVLFALGLERLRPAALRGALVALLVATACFGLMRYDRDEGKEPWREAAARIGAAASGAPTTVLVTFDVDPFLFYGRRLARPVDAFEVGHPDEPFAAHYTPRQLDELEAAARAHARRFADVWVIVRSPNSEVRREVARRALAVAAEGRVAVEDFRLESPGGGLRVAHFAPAPPPAR